MFRCSFICMFAVLIKEVSLQVTVKAVIGGSVVLPCSSAERDHKLRDNDVHWRDKNDKIVYSIINGNDSVVGQDPRYKNRAETFVAEFLRGNFSIKLINITQADAGKYTCFITDSSEYITVLLIIKESTAEKENKSNDQGNQGEDVVTSSPMFYVCIILPVFLFVGLIVGFIIFLLRN